MGDEYKCTSPDKCEEMFKNVHNKMDGHVETLEKSIDQQERLAKERIDTCKTSVEDKIDAKNTLIKAVNAEQQKALCEAIADVKKDNKDQNAKIDSLMQWRYMWRGAAFLWPVIFWLVKELFAK